MREPATVARSSALPRSQNIGSLLLLALTLLLPVGAVAQEPNGTAATPPAQTAARARVPAQPSPQSLASRNSASPLQSLVSFADGQLSINAANVSLSDVLFAVRAATGADIDVPNNASSERVTAQLGPGPARKVLADLLGWSSFDYIIQGSDDDPLEVHSITLMVRVRTGAAGTNAVIAASTAPGNSIPGRTEPEASTTTEVAIAEGHPEQPAAAPDIPEPPPNLQPKVSAATPNQGWGGAGGASAGKSPSEMIQELQQMYQQRRILQEQQNQATGQRSP